jgi:hypothetical protein
MNTTPSAYLPLPEPWDNLYHQIADASRIFWQQATYHDHGRQQSDSIWLLLQRKLHELLDTLFGKAPLTSFEIFLLRAATHLYESGWQAEGAPELPVAQRYRLSGKLIRENYQQREQAIDFGLSKLAPATVEILARLCASVGQRDLSSLSLEEPDWGGYQETVRLRYLAALLQIGDALLSRQKAPYFYNLPHFREDDEPGLALQSYVNFTLEVGQITTHICINPDDKDVIDKMTTLIEEPIRRWWAANWRWLCETLQITINLHTTLPVHSALQEPLRKRCRILFPYLQTYQPLIIALPAPEQIHEACARATDRKATNTFLMQQGEHPSISQAKGRLTMAGEKEAVEIFYSYSHKDRRYRDQLETQLTLLKREGLISSWSDRKIRPGEECQGQIDSHLNISQIILLLISSDFIASDYAYDVEMRRAMERHIAGEARVIPIILRPCDWHKAPFGRLHALPENGKPVTDRSWHTLDEAFFQIAQGIRKAVEELTLDQ